MLMTSDKTEKVADDYEQFLIDNDIQEHRTTPNVQVVFLMYKIAELEERLEQSEIKEI
jgi:ribosomal protein S15P/S13E